MINKIVRADLFAGVIGVVVLLNIIITCATTAVVRRRDPSEHVALKRRAVSRRRENPESPWTFSLSYRQIFGKKPGRTFGFCDRPRNEC